jgi:uncharacterized protein YbaR (Trm112 family)
MPIDSQYLETLYCPITKSRLELLNRDQLNVLNELIHNKQALFIDGAMIEDELQEALVTIDHRMIYRVVEGIPMMLPERAIPFEQLEEE